MMANLPIVGIGASAGGGEALEQFFRAMPVANGLAFVVLTHLPPNFESMLAEILGRATRMPVFDARHGEVVQAQQVYVLPPGAILTIRSGRLQLRRTGTADRVRAPIDVFFTSLAKDQAEHAIGIVLSGGGSDGTLGLKAIKEKGGLTVAQGSNLTRPRFAEMPSSAVASGFVDLLLPVENIPERIVAYVRDWHALAPEPVVNALPRVHSVLRARTGHDFGEYKDSTFQRRVHRRMQVIQMTNLEDYVERLQKDPDELGALFRDLLIGVTSFFRDPAAFGSLETLVIPKLFEGKGADGEVRVWVTGCSTGDEAYSIAMLLREYLDTLQVTPKLKIFATDIDEAAMRIARSARYPANSVKEVSPERLKRFFVHEADGSYRLAKDLREMCIFSTHSVIRDPPFSRLDLISCRNLLIYLQSRLQGQIIPLFHYALRPGGYLFLGLSENVARYNDLFHSLDRKNRVFQRSGLVARPLIPLKQFLPHARQDSPGSDASQRTLLQGSRLLLKVANTVVAQFAPAYVIVNRAGEALYFSAGTGKYLQAAPGPPTRDVIAMARPGLRADLRAALQIAAQSGRQITRDRVAVQADGGVEFITLAVEPISEGSETAYGVVFIDRGGARRQDESGGAERSAAQDNTIQQIERELQESQERLQATIEELETANEEFRSSNEELVSLNEELQSTNEELETSKEELQSVNEELQSVNNEFSLKIEQLDRANSDLTNLFESTQIATIFLDRNLAIRFFTPTVTKLFNLIPGDRGRPLSDIVGRIVYPKLDNDLRQVFSGGQLIERSVSLVDGKGYYLARIHPYRDSANVMDGAVVSFVDVTSIAAAEEQQKVLAAELSHRVRNTLAVVSSIAERTLPNGHNKNDLIGRFHALGHTHDLLSQAGWTQVPLRELVLSELAPHTTGDGSNARADGPPIMLKPQAALLLALVIHELATNAAKYGALSTPGGWVMVAWAIIGGGARQLELTWTEQGGPKIDGLPKRGFGTELIERGIRFELQGESQIDVVDGGLHCRIVIPANPQYITFGVSPDRSPIEEAAS
jgi:two-component system, chemotaxis family, CheB/CheR fusion protein